MKQFAIASLAAMLAGGVITHARADAVTDWNVRAGDFIVEAKLGPPPAMRIMALTQTAVADAVQAAAQSPAGKASVDAAVAAANRATLARLLPQQEAAITAAYQAALAVLPEGPARNAGVDAGERAAAAVLAARADDGAATPERYRPTTTPGAYVPTATPAVPQWPQRKPWLLARADQFRPGPPPALDSALWARDYNEVKTLGSKASTVRTAEQTEIARFWEYSLPPIYYGVVRSVAAQPGRDIERNARLYAAVAQGMDDAMVAVLEAKYQYGFWRPITAIRNGDQDGNAATERDAGWVPFSDVPLHPEYPSAHSILAGTVGTVLQADLGHAPVPTLSTASPSAKGAVRRWSRVEDMMQEVAEARIYEGIHYRVSTEAGLAMGRKVGALAAQRHLAPH
jgi:hypothetical protein